MYCVMWFLEDGEYVGFCVEFLFFLWFDVILEGVLVGICWFVVDVVSEMIVNGEIVFELIVD